MFLSLIEWSGRREKTNWPSHYHTIQFKAVDFNDQNVVWASDADISRPNGGKKAEPEIRPIMQITHSK